MAKEKDWDLVIKPRKKLLDIDFKGIWQYRDLFRMFVKRDIITVYKQTILGPLWFFFQPVFTTVMYMFVFATLAGISTGGIPQALFYMSGTLLWNYFNACFTTGQNTFTGNQGIFSKVYFPRLVAPLAGITSGFIKALIQTLPLIVVYIYYVIDGEPIHLTWEFLLTPVLFVLIALMGLGCGLIISALTVRYRDLNNLVTFGLQLWMYSTPVIYPVSISGDRTLTAFLKGNPLQGIFTDFRYMLTGIGEMDWWGLLYSFVFTIAILFLGIIIFNRQERTFMDTI
ncbi:MAG: ABC transporter permease [Bacteroidales bacterium]|nr:ABC transporter permease [Bacteroidales bacterium]